MEGAIAVAAPALLPAAAGVRAKEYASWLQRCMKRPQHTRQRLTGDVKQHGIGEHAVEVLGRQTKLKEILVQHVAATVSARHLGKPRGALKAGGVVAEFLECLEITSRPTPEVKQL